MGKLWATGLAVALVAGGVMVVNGPRLATAQGGGTIEAVQWTGADEYISEPVVWK